MRKSRPEALCAVEGQAPTSLLLKVKEIEIRFWLLVYGIAFRIEVQPDTSLVLLDNYGH